MMIASIRDAKPADALELAKLKVDGWRSAFRGIVHQSYLDAMSYEQESTRIDKFLTEGKDRFHWLFAEDEHGRPLGFSCGGPNRTPLGNYDGELWAIYVDSSFHRHGIGRMLVSATAQRLGVDGFTNMIIWCLKDNPHCKFYEKMGGEIVGEKLSDIGGARLAEFGYGFKLIPNIFR
jgi:GNAT superfamily N-acetyltransferase